MASINPDNLLQALEALQPILPELVGAEGWTKLSPSFEDTRVHLKKSTDELERRQLTAEIIGMLAPFAEARETLRKAMDPYYAVFSGLSSLAGDLGLQADKRDELEAAAAADEAQRLMLLPKEGSGEAKSIKLGNFDFDFGEMGELIAGIVLTSKDIAGETNHQFMAAGVLLIAVSVYKAFTFEIEEQETSVFWGFIQACGEKSKTATEEAILEATNAEREKIGKRLLDADEVNDSLHQLAEIKCVERVEDQAGNWRIIEKYHVKN